MNDIKKRKEIETLFLANGFTQDEFVVGTGKTFSKKGINKERFEFEAKNRKPILNKTAKYAVKYFFDYDFYIVWKTNRYASLNGTQYCTVFTVDSKDAISAYKNNMSAHKGVGFEWNFKENVEVVNFENLKILIENLSKQEGIK